MLRLPCHVKSLEGQKKLLSGYQLNNEGLFLKTDRVSSDQDFKIAFLSTVFQTFNVFILLS